jgi:hypothetical protein
LLWLIFVVACLQTFMQQNTGHEGTMKTALSYFLFVTSFFPRLFPDASDTRRLHVFSLPATGRTCAAAIDVSRTAVSCVCG